MSKVIVTNTLGKPIFIFGKLITPGASLELDEGDVPDALKKSVSKPEDATKQPATEGVVTDPPPAKTDEELLVEAAAKAKK
ncbi:MAG: hypothetical protein BWK73_04570 [Thiothrix lacustris]|uniref:Uncharacterized protein n=1 Tax=Thiothrix lacustris TaxID=525917 RepID=A0A1Y1QY65_9GAMM|nr:MAG: hypothetical protein BWK73_04570 [Thiothrix lacustris]